VEFESKEKFMEWWRNHNMFVPEAEAKVFDLLPDKMKLTKNVFALHLVK